MVFIYEVGLIKYISDTKAFSRPPDSHHMRTHQGLPEVRLERHFQSPSLLSACQHRSELLRELSRALENPTSAGRGRRLAANGVLYSQSSEAQKRGPGVGSLFLESFTLETAPLRAFQN